MATTANDYATLDTPTITRNNNQDSKETRFGVQPKNNSADMDYLDIPAFLRRQAD
jgi:cell division protein FtsZ